jgi:hypothetical protein
VALNSIIFSKSFKTRTHGSVNVLVLCAFTEGYSLIVIIMDLCDVVTDITQLGETVGDLAVQNV